MQECVSTFIQHAYKAPMLMNGKPLTEVPEGRICCAKIGKMSEVENVFRTKLASAKTLYMLILLDRLFRSSCKNLTSTKKQSVLLTLGCILLEDSLI